VPGLNSNCSTTKGGGEGETIKGESKMRKIDPDVISCHIGLCWGEDMVTSWWPSPSIFTSYLCAGFFFVCVFRGDQRSPRHSLRIPRLGSFPLYRERVEISLTPSSLASSDITSPWSLLEDSTWVSIHRDQTELCQVPCDSLDWNPRLEQGLTTHPGHSPASGWVCTRVGLILELSQGNPVLSPTSLF
jgi:hypothetical protein